jgi:hypothetical protein
VVRQNSSFLVFAMDCLSQGKQGNLAPLVRIPHCQGQFLTAPKHHAHNHTMEIYKDASPFYLIEKP